MRDIQTNIVSTNRFRVKNCLYVFESTSCTQTDLVENYKLFITNIVNIFLQGGFRSSTPEAATTTVMVAVCRQNVLRRRHLAVLVVVSVVLLMSLWVQIPLVVEQQVGRLDVGSIAVTTTMGEFLTLCLCSLCLFSFSTCLCSSFLLLLLSVLLQSVFLSVLVLSILLFLFSPHEKINKSETE